MKTIIVQTDISGHATPALHFAGELARQSKSKLLLVYALPEQTVISLEGSRQTLAPDPQLLAQALDQLKELGRQLRQQTGPGLETEALCLTGSQPEQLHALIRSQGAGLVVLGEMQAASQGQGSGSYHFFSQGLCPVLVLPETAIYRGFKRVAYASDFETEEEAPFLRQLLAFTAPYAPEIYIVNVKSDQQLGVVPDQKVLRNIGKQFPDQAFSLVQLRQEEVAAGLQAFVADNQIDLLALSTHKRTWLESLFHHSLSRELCRHPFVPLLTLPAHPFQMPEQSLPQKLPECL